jgi:hypothetical protein
MDRRPARDARRRGRRRRLRRRPHLRRAGEPARDRRPGTRPVSHLADLFFFDDPATAMRARASLGGPSAVLLRLNAVAVVRHRANDTPRFTEVFLSTGDAVMGG